MKSAKTNAVRLRKNLLRWRKLPFGIRQQITVGTDRVAQIRSAIVEAAPVSSMPPVDIVDVGWAAPHGAIFGKASVLRFGKMNAVGAIIPASTLISVKNDATLRAILVHEFAHCFHMLTQMVKAMDSGSTSVVDIGQGDVFNAEHDRDLQVDPGDWFGVEDVERFVQQGHSALKTPMEAMAKEWIGAGLPTEMPSTRLSVQGQFSIPEEAIAHIRKLVSLSEP